MTKPETGYFICGTPRSGSGVLGETLWRTHIAGKPDQYFLEENVRKFSQVWDVAEFPQYLEALLENATSENGVFGLRLTAGQAKLLAQQLIECRLLDASADGWDAADFLAGKVPGLHYVWLRRRDYLRQAISLWRARRSRIHRRRLGETAPAGAESFSFEEIEAVRQRFEAYDLGWTAYFEARRLSPLVLWYEDDIETDVVAAARRILDYAGIDVPADLAISVHREKLADAESERLVGLYEEAAAAASS